MMSEILLLPESFDTPPETDIPTINSEAFTVIDDRPKPQIKPRRTVGRIASFAVSAVIFASCAVSFGEAIENEFMPCGYVMAQREMPVGLTLAASSKQLPLSKPEPSDDAEIATEAPPEPTIPEGSLRIVEHDFSGTGLSNETSYRPDLDLLLNTPLPIGSYTRQLNSLSYEPEVLIIHTHGSEAYTDEGDISYPADSGMRSYDITENVVAVGSAITERLMSLGVNTLHLTEMFDRESYYNSYNRSLEAVKQALAEYPSIRYIIDVHRDAAADVNKGIAYKPVTEIGGKKCAQLMLVVGTDYLGASHPHWQNNLSAALKLNELLSEISPSLVRPINLRGASFNQQYSTGFLLLEAGSCANTLDEAVRSGEYFADCLAELINTER